MTNSVVGKKIVDMKIAADKEAILFVTEEGEKLVARTDGDCCSQSWVESIEMPALGLPFVVTGVSDLDLNREGEWQGEYDFVQFYGCKVETTAGDMIIDFRNSSNGYYGGSLVWPGERHYYGGVYGQNVSEEEWAEIVDAG